MVILYSCFYFLPKYYRPAASDGHRHDKILRLELSALAAKVELIRQPDHSCMQLGTMNNNHTNKFTFLLNTNVQNNSLYTC